ncbi:hypothetical protein BGZ49_008909 [Haplosporangium sp. Z 27]|nr:hypothetical protein BGZ49_008909 [Haplosporangium sp. Z 27]
MAMTQAPVENGNETPVEEATSTLPSFGSESHAPSSSNQSGENLTSAVDQPSLSSPVIIATSEAEPSGGLERNSLQQQRNPDTHCHQTKEISFHDQMSSISIENITNPQIPLISTNPFRRSPSVSPPSNPSAISTASDEFLGENPFSIVSSSQNQLAMSTAPTLPARTADSSRPVPLVQLTAADVPPELPPPPAYELVVGTPTSAVTPNTATSEPSEPSEPQTLPRPIPEPIPEVASAEATPVVVTPPITAVTPPAIPPRTSTSREPEPSNQYVLKPIDWIDPSTGIEKRIKIITQNGKVAIRPYDRPDISYDHLLELLANYLLHEDIPEDTTSSSSTSQHNSKTKSRLEIESALRLLPHLEHGLDVNVFFKSIRGFEPTRELGLFHTFGVELVHGWIVNPTSDGPMFSLVDGPAGITSYNKAVECIVSGDDAGGGLVVEDLRGNFTPISPSSQSSAAASRSTSPQEGEKENERITHALIVQEFMNATKTQLTPYGLHVLKESLPEGHLCAFFRNNHFCTLFKNPMDGQLYTLVTDQSLAHEQSIVWESLLTVDGAGDFLDGLFRHGTLEIGDYARNNQPESQLSDGDGGGDEDFALALQLQQQEEEEEAQRIQRSKSRVSGTHGNRHEGTRPSFETDEQMAARLHQEYLQSSQQQQQHHYQQPQHQYQMQGSGKPYPAPYPGVVNQYPSSGTPSSQSFHPPAGYPHPTLQPRPSTGQRPSNIQGNKPSGHNRIQNSSSSSSGKNKDEKCIIS